ncbi:sporulation protein YqfD [Rossellomorea aquimaris]|uniref:sporulation protein YqfD n=1 Tax=Rossellomorea TaxID=2837508 RepID=UPI001CD2D8C9|nr:sporulation protein YqfD [Rossellomorea aquimaris]MCA1058009.1 sporulation protein YqfD [Rossellomorea aquimaris]
MKNQWFTFLKGKVFVKMEGRLVERVINQLLRADIAIWNVRRAGTETITFYLSLEDVHNFRRAVRASGCKVTFLRGQGVPFLFKRSLKNSGFMIGGVAFFIIVFLLSNMVWDIQIKGASPQTEHSIRKELKEMGVSKGKMQFSIPDVENIQRELSFRMNNITWVGVELQGTTFHFQVVEKNAPEAPESTGLQHIVAKKKAIITDMFVEEGDPQVSVNDYVNKGQLLVSGLIGNEKEPKGVSAKAKILGETWYKTSVELPLKSRFAVFSGNEKRKHYLGFGSLDIPIWGFGKTEFKNVVVEETKKNLRFLKWELPIYYIDRSMKEKEDVERTYTKSEAINAAKKLAKSNLESSIPEDAEIRGEKILQEKVENGKVRVTIHFKVIENIAVGQPIIQGD